MITKWQLFNFKSIKESTELDFGPLTLFAGSNSSGKSTVLQSMLMVTQTLSNKVGSRSVVLNGDLVRLGQFSDLKSAGSYSDQILVGWEIRGSDGGRLQTLSDQARLVSPRSGFVGGMRCTIAFDASSDREDRDIRQLHPSLFSVDVEADVRSQGEEYRTVKMRAIRREFGFHQKSKEIQILPQDTESARAALQYDIELDMDSPRSFSDDVVDFDFLGCSFRHFLPNQLYVRVDTYLRHAHLLASAICEWREPYQSRYRFREVADYEIPTTVVLLLRKSLQACPRIDRTQIRELVTGLERGSRHKFRLHQWQDLLGKLPPRDRTQLMSCLRERDGLYQEIVDFILQARIRNPHAVRTQWDERSLQYESDDVEVLIEQALNRRRYERLSSARQESESRYRLETVPLPLPLSHVTTTLETHFSTSIRYLGPLRNEPKALYPLALASDPQDVGLRGESTAAVLDTYRSTHVEYIPSLAFAKSSISRGTATRTLETAVMDWLQYLSVAQKIQIQDRGKLGHELQVLLEDSGVPSDLTHVGVGVSQVLPIVVMCLLADPDTTLILEQPELHLHPKVQTLLGDFFLSMAMLNKQCIIETHSEYLINRLRLRAAQATEGEISRYIKMYFVEKEEGASRFREVVVNDYGAIQDWPSGFFDQSQREAEEILRAAMLKRKSRRPRSE